jgi:hypothetical protein
MVKYAPWTDEDNERIKALVAKGASVFRASAALKRTRIGVRDQARRLGTPFPTLRETRKKIAEADRNLHKN